MKRKNINLIKRCLKKKWIPIVYGLKEDGGSDDCALCGEYLRQVQRCSGCPVSEKTGKDGCAGSPFITWLEAFLRSTDELIAPFEWYLPAVIDERTQRAAIAECVFLNELLPPEERLDLGDM